MNEQYYQQRRPEIAAFLPNEYASVLEIGCGEGHFAENLQQSTERWAVEMNIASAIKAEQQYKHVISGKYEEVHKRIPNNYFDVIICNDVVEHMQDSDWFLSHIHNKLSDSGVLILSIPNVRFIGNLIELLIFKDWQYKDYGILDKTHLRFFTRKSLTRTLKQNGWTISKMQNINRYGRKFWGPKRLLSYLTQLILGWDTAYMQFAVVVKKNAKS